MSALAKHVAALLVCAAVLAGCGDDTDNPAPSETAPTVSADVAPTTAPPDSDAVTATQAPTATEEAETTTSSSTATGNAAGTAATAPSAEPIATGAAGTTPPAATTAPAAQGGCTEDVLSQDILGFPGGVSVYFCDGDWAYAVYPDAPGAPEFIAERVDGRWFHAVTIGDPVCREDLAARGAPPTIAKLLPGCEEPAPTAPPTSAPPTTAPPTAPPTDPPAADCIISTNLYGDTVADLIAVTCGDATAEWELAEANAEPSWAIPWITPTGWECYVSPYDATSKAAGACYAPEGNAQFTLYVQ